MPCDAACCHSGFPEVGWDRASMSLPPGFALRMRKTGIQSELDLEGYNRNEAGGMRGAWVRGRSPGHGEVIKDASLWWS